MRPLPTRRGLVSCRAWGRRKRDEEEEEAHTPLFETDPPRGLVTLEDAR